MYSTYLAQRRDRVGPADSGEWPPVEFRRLAKPREERASPAPTVIASLIVVAGYVASVLLFDAEFAALLAIVLSPTFAAVGVLWITQFRRMTENESGWLGVIWGFIGFAAMTPIEPVLLAGFICIGLTGGGSALGAWLTTLIIHRRTGDGNA